MSGDDLLQPTIRNDERALKLDTALAWFAGAWIVYCVYSWIAPPIVRWLLRRR